VHRLVANSDPSLPSLLDPYPDPAPTHEDLRSSQRNLLPSGRTVASGRGKRRSAAAGPSRLTQTRLDDYLSRRVNATPGPSRLSTPTLSIATVSASVPPAAPPNPDILLTQDFDDLIRSSNYFAPLTPEDHSSSPAEAATVENPPSSSQISPPLVGSQLSPASSPAPPVPSHPRSFPNHSPNINWDDPVPPPPAASLSETPITATTTSPSRPMPDGPMEQSACEFDK
jgi:hypothetical protein